MNYRADFHAPFSFVGTDFGMIENDNNWNYGYPLKTGFQLNFVENFGFLINLYTDEKDPVKNFCKNGDPVYRDSCLEFFANFAPDRSDKYLNFEFGAGGGSLAGSGESRENRIELKNFYENADFTVSVRDEGWDVMAFIPLDVIFSVYGNIDFKPGYTFKANFYKCCEDKRREHYLSWAPIKTASPDFHRPEFFGDITLDRSIERI